MTLQTADHAIISAAEAARAGLPPHAHGLLLCVDEIGRFTLATVELELHRLAASVPTPILARLDSTSLAAVYPLGRLGWPEDWDAIS